METTEITKQPPQQLTIKSLFGRDDIKKKFEEMLGKKAQGFITSVLQIAASNALLAKADPMSIYNAAATAATLDLPLNNNLGFAYIVPYNNRQPDGSTKTVAQFQIGWKGFVQLAQRSGQFKTISATPIYEGQIAINNPLTGIVFDFETRKSDIVIGYAAYFQLLNGFYKTLYMSVDEVRRHGSRYSKTFKNKNSVWENDFDAMATKTVLKLLLSKYAPLSIEMQKAVIADQGLINNEEATDVTYVDNEEVIIDKEAERLLLMVKDCKTVDDVELLRESLPDVDTKIFDDKIAELKGGKK